MMLSQRPLIRQLRHKVHLLLDSGGSDRASHIVHASIVALVCASIASVVLETVPEFRRTYGAEFALVEGIAAGAFTIEYLLRIWVAPELTPYLDVPPLKARLRFLLSASAMIDLLSILPFFLAFFLPQEFRILILLRLLRFFKLARYSPGMSSLMAALEAERRALFAASIVLLGLVLVAAAAMHLAEHDAQPDAFGSIPAAMWWAVVTLTTVGYGDVVPVTLAGRIVASVTMLAGLMMIALPIGIVANAFAEQIHRREFVVTWGMIARVPLFSSLSASEIAEVMNCLRAQTVPTDEIIVRRGDTATCMYFIASGEVEVELPRGPIRLGEGQFFGEMSLLRHTERLSTVRSAQPTKLLVLEARDLKALMERNPLIAARLEAVVRERE